MKTLVFLFKMCPFLLGMNLLIVGQVQAKPLNQKWVYPTDSKEISNPYNPPAQNWLTGHRGIDFLASIGDAVYSIGDGWVSFAGEIAGKGVLVISHGLVRTTYEPVVATVKVGQKVIAGQLIGYLSPGESHCATQVDVMCLHLGALLNDKYLNPMLLLNPRVRLLPIRNNPFQNY